MPLGTLLGRAIRIAAEAHETQLDKADAPYILHPLRMMSRAQTLSEQIVAVLHDVVEDSEKWKIDVLRREGYPETIVRAVEVLTNTNKADYEGFIDRVVGESGEPGRIARRVKLLDLEDNMMLTRLEELDQKALERLQRYHKAHRRVTEAIAKDGGT